MAWLALGNALGRRCGRSDCALCRPTLGGEIGRDLAKILLRKAFGDGRHDRVVAFAIPVVAHLLEKIAPLLPPDNRDGFGVGGHAVLAVTGCAELGRGLDVIGGMAIPARRIPAPRSVGNRRVRMALLLPAVSTNGVGFTRVSRDGIPEQSRPARAPPPA